MFILASSSPRRKEILAKLVPSFEIIVPDIDESILDLPPKDLALEESKAKAYTISSKYPSDEILACDTVVIYANKALGKPHNKENAIAMLKMLNGKKHIVTSGYTYIGNGKEINRTVSTEVYFNELSDTQIEEYVNKFKPFDKAGSYGIQDDYPLIKEIKGSYYNVMGLPIEDIAFHVYKTKFNR